MKDQHWILTILLKDLSKKVLKICEQPAAVADYTPHGVTLHSRPAQILASTWHVLYVIP